MGLKVRGPRSFQSPAGVQRTPSSGVSSASFCARPPGSWTARSSQPTRKAGRRVQRPHSTVPGAPGRRWATRTRGPPPCASQGEAGALGTALPAPVSPTPSRHAGLHAAPEATHGAFAPAPSLGTLAPDPPVAPSRLLGPGLIGPPPALPVFPGPFLPFPHPLHGVHFYCLVLCVLCR